MHARNVWAKRLRTVLTSCAHTLTVCQGDFGLAIKFDEEIPFSRSGTLDYMAPEVC